MKRRGDISTIIIVLVLVLLVLVGIPAFQSLINTNTKTMKSEDDTFSSFHKETRKFYNSNINGTNEIPFK